MKRTYSMQGFELRLVGGVIELRAQGERTVGDELAPARVFSSMARHLSSRLILYDIRDADYRLDARQWEERFRFVARLFKGYRIAYVTRADQAETARQSRRAHARNGDKADVFNSRDKAHAWLIHPA